MHACESYNLKKNFPNLLGRVVAYKYQLSIGIAICSTSGSAPKQISNEYQTNIKQISNKYQQTNQIKKSTNQQISIAHWHCDEQHQSGGAPKHQLHLLDNTDKFASQRFSWFLPKICLILIQSGWKGSDVNICRSSAHLTGNYLAMALAAMWYNVSLFADGDDDGEVDGVMKMMVMVMVRLMVIRLIMCWLW